jgi:hypothetical protein
MAKAYEPYEVDRIDKVDSKQLEAWYTLVHVSQRWRILCVWITASPQSTASLHNQQTCEADARCLANLAHRHTRSGTLFSPEDGAHGKG